MSVGQTGHASLWGGQGNIVLQVRARRRSRIIPSVGICHITFLPVTQDWHSWRWLLSGSLTCTRSLLHSGLTNDRPALQLCHIRPVSRQSGSDLSSSLLHHNNIFPSLACLLTPDIRHCILSVSLLFSTLSLQGKNVFSSMQTTQIERYVFIKKRKYGAGSTIVI